jgi:hypothetical protein
MSPHNTPTPRQRRVVELFATKTGSACGFEKKYAMPIDLFAMF